MKKLFFALCALALFVTACKDPVKPIDLDVEDGVYVYGEATGFDKVDALLRMANGINEANNQTPRDGMFEKYIVLEGGKEFSLLWLNAGVQTYYGATLAEFTPELGEDGKPTGEVYNENPATGVFKGALVVGENAPKMKVSATGLYHIVLDLNKDNALADAQIVVCPVTMGVRGGMNSWNFTALEATPASNSGITFVCSGQELAAGGEFKFAYNNAWKITLDAEGKVKANTNLGAGCKPGGDNIVVTEGAGTYKITLTFKLAEGDIANSFSYNVEQQSASAAPETMFMVGEQFGGWDWNSDGIVELVPIWGTTGKFWCTRWFDATKGFKFCSVRAWNGDFTGAGTVGYTVSDGNCWVAESGFYTVFIDGNDGTVEIAPAKVYGLGDAVFTGGWDFDSAEELVAEGDKLVITTSGAGELRLASKVVPTVADNQCTANGWYDWWKTEFVFYEDGKIVYRAGGNDQERFNVEAGKTIVLDLNAGTATIEEPFVGVISIDGDFSDWDDVPSAEPADAFQAFKVTNDAKNFYFYVECDPGSRLWSGGAYLYLYFNFKNDLTQGAYSGSTGMKDNKYDAYIFMYLFGGNADAPVIENNPNGGEAKGLSLDKIVIAGNQPATSADIVKMEIVIPRANFTDQVNAGDVIEIDSYRSKDGGNIYMPGYVVK